MTQSLLDFSEQKHKVNTVYYRVKQIMEQHPRARDEYPVLDYHYYPQNITLLDALKLMKEKKLASVESVHRARRKVEEEFPHLRGDSYVKRHAKASDTTDTVSMTPVDAIEAIS